MIENSKYHSQHQAMIDHIKRRLQAQGWIVQFLDQPDREMPVFGVLPDLMAVTPEGVLCYIEYKKKTWNDFFEYYEPSRFLAYRNLVNDSGIPLILAILDEKSELMEA